MRWTIDDIGVYSREELCDGIVPLSRSRSVADILAWLNRHSRGVVWQYEGGVFYCLPPDMYYTLEDLP